MTKKHTLLLAALFSFGAMSAEVKDYSLKIGEFTELTVVDGINVVYRCDAARAGEAEFTCEPDMSSDISFQCNNHKLKIELTGEQPYRGLPTVTVYSSAITKVSNWGDSTITVGPVNPSADFTAEVIGNGSVVARDVRATKAEAAIKSGNGHIFITGKAQTVKLVNCGTGAVEAGGLEGMKVKVNMLGTGSVDCNATEELTVTGAGGKVYYRGAPKIKNRTVGVKIIPMD